MYKLIYAPKAKEHLNELRNKKQIKKAEKVKRALDKIIENPRHPGLHTHKYKTLKGFNGEDVLQSYVENKTPGAFRIFWHYSSKEDNTIVILAITPHP